MAGYKKQGTKIMDNAEDFLVALALASLLGVSIVDILKIIDASLKLNQI